MVRHPPVATADGTLLPAYDEEQRQAVLLRRTVHDTQWREAYRFQDPPLLQPVLVRDTPARLSLFFRPWSDPRVIWRSHSNTEGRQWSTPVRTTLPCPLSGIGAFALSDRLGVVYNHTEHHARHPLSLSVSRDGGLSWSQPWHFENINYEVSYPQFLAHADGGAHGVYSYNRRVIKYVHFELGDIP
jgi:predicted neuraminidase